MSSARYELEPDAATQRAWLKAAGEIVMDHVASLGGALTVADPRALDPGPSAHGVGEAPLEGGVEAALSIVAGAARAAFSTTAPGYLAYVPGGGLFATAVADLVADVLNRYTGLVAAAPALARLESDVLSWLCAEFGYGPGAAGLFTSGGSLAMFAAVVAAREARLEADADLRLAVGYTSVQAHASVAAAFRLAGLPTRNLRAVPVDDAFRLRPDRLLAMVGEDRARGFTPFIVVATAGSTNTGAIDPLPQIAALCADKKLWLHVDGAYGGAFVLCDEGRRRLRGMELADSIVFDPHKGLFLPYGTGCLLLRDGAPVARAGDHGYLRDVRSQDAEHAPASPADFGLELSRPFRGLRVWLPMMLHGAAAFREALAEKLELAATFHRGLEDLVREGLPIEIVAAPQLSVVAFRLSRLAAEPLDRWNRRNAAFLTAVNAPGRCYLSSTLLPAVDGDAVTLRVCILSHRTHIEQVQHCLQDMRLAVETPQGHRLR